MSNDRKSLWIGLWIAILLLVTCSVVIIVRRQVNAQSLSYTPSPVGAYVNSGGGWMEWAAGSGTGQLTYNPSPVGLYCNSGSGWTPCNPVSGGSPYDPTNVAITGGTIDGAVIGGTTPAAGTFYPFQANGSSGTPTSFFTQLTSTNSGSTSGIPAGYGCAIVRTYISGVNYNATALCSDNLTSTQATHIYYSTNTPITSPSFTQVLSINASGNVSTNNSYTATNSFINTPHTITASATPVISNTQGLQTITLSANATPTIVSAVSGMRITLRICQPASGGPYTWTWPAIFSNGMTIGTNSNTCSQQSFNSFDGATYNPESVGVTNTTP